MGFCNGMGFYKLVCGIGKEVSNFFLFGVVCYFNDKLMESIIGYFLG